MSTINWLPGSTPSVNDNESLTNYSETRSVPNGCVVLRVSNATSGNNENDLITHAAERTFDMVGVVFLYICSFISIPTNFLNMMVFTKQGLRERINLCLFCQAFSDLGYMLFSLLLYADRFYTEILHLSGRGPVFTFISNYKLIIFFAFQWTSRFISMVISCERCFCVVSPLRSQRILKTRTMLVIILVAFAVIFAGFGFTCMRWSVTCIFNPVTGFSVMDAYPDKFYLQHRQAVDIVDGVLLGMILPCTFLSTVVTTTVVTVQKLRHFATWRREQASLTSTSGVQLTTRDVNLTRMLVACSVLFIITNIPSLMYRTSTLVFPDFNVGKRYQNTYIFFGNAIEICSYTNCTFNFFIYYSIGTKYKETLFLICGKNGKHGKKEANFATKLSVVSKSF